MAAPNVPDMAPLFEVANIFAGGQDASKFPALVDQTSYFAGVNTNVAKGLITPRFGLVKKSKLAFPNGGITQPITNVFVPYEEIFRGGRFQALIPYNIGNIYSLIVVISGVIFLINQTTWEVTVLPIQEGGSLNENTPRLNWSSANKFLVIYDYPNFPVVFDGVTVKRSSSYADGVPVSVGGIYNQNRLFIYNAGNSYTAGDPTGSLASPNAPVTFEEILLPGSPVFGEAFDLPTDRVEPITAMANLQLVDTSTGVGPLLIGTRNAIYSIQSQTPRIVIDAQGNQNPGWQTNGFASAFVLNAGIAGARACVNVNSDLFFMSSDGEIRSASMSRQEQGKWARTPVSKEVQNWIGKPDPKLVQYSVSGYFKNKIFFSVNPYRTNAFNTERKPIFDVAHGGMVVLSLDNMAVLGKDSTPAWDGLWTGVRPLDMCQNLGRFFIMSKDDNTINELYEMDPDITYDRDGDNVRYADAIIYTKEYDFKSPQIDKDIYSMDLDLRNVKGDLEVQVDYRPSQTDGYIKWRGFKKCAPWRFCEYPPDAILNGLAPHNYFSLNLGSPEQGDTCSLPSGVQNNVFRSVQLKISIKGAYWVLQSFRVKALVRSQTDTIYGLDDPTACVKIPKSCNRDWDYGGFISCLVQQT